MRFLLPVLALSVACKPEDTDTGEERTGVEVSSFADLPGDRLEIHASYSDTYALLYVSVGYQEFGTLIEESDDCAILTGLEATATGVNESIEDNGGVDFGGWDGESCVLPGVTVGLLGEVVGITFTDSTGAELEVEFTDISATRDIVWAGHALDDEPALIMGQTARFESTGGTGDHWIAGPVEVEVSHTPDNDGTQYWTVEGTADATGVEFTLPTDLPAGARFGAYAPESPLWNGTSKCEGAEQCLLPAHIRYYGYAIATPP